MPVEHINKTDTLNEGREKLNAAIDGANAADVTSQEADTKATQALSNSESTQTQLDTIVIDGDSSVEAAQARVDEKGESHATLKARIDDGMNSVNTQLAQIVTLSSNYPTIQEAINNTDSNGVLYLEKNKEYTISEDIILNKNIEIHGNGSTLIVESENGIIGNGEYKSKKLILDSYEKGSYYILLEDTIGIQIGDLLNITSSELYDPTRNYYFKGGNVLVDKVVGNRVLMSMPFPFNMDNTTTVEVYKPITVNIDNLNIIGDGVLPHNKYGIMVSFGVNCTFTNINIDNFTQNIRYDRLINTSVYNVNTLRAKELSTNSWDGYGHAIYSCTNITINNSTTKSGQHGITWGGQELNYGVTISDCKIDNEVSPYGLGQHENIHDVVIENCDIFSFSLAGQVIMLNCDIYPNSNGQNKNNLLSPADNFDKNSYKFSSVRFNDTNLLTADYYQVDSPNRKFIDKILVENCKGLSNIRTNINFQRNGAKVGEVNLIKVVDTETTLIMFDNVNEIILSNVKTPSGVPALQQTVRTPQNVIGKIVLRDIELNDIYNTITLNKANHVVLDNVEVPENSEANSGVFFSNIELLIISNSDLSSFNRGVSLVNIETLNMSNSTIKFNTNITGTQGMQAVTNARGSNINDTIKNCEVITTPTGKKYIITYNEDGSTSNQEVPS